jgi:hypothetical protein
VERLRQEAREASSRLVEASSAAAAAANRVRAAEIEQQLARERAAMERQQRATLAALQRVQPFRTAREAASPHRHGGAGEEEARRDEGTFNAYGDYIVERAHNWEPPVRGLRLSLAAPVVATVPAQPRRKRSSADAAATASARSAEAEAERLRAEVASLRERLGEEERGASRRSKRSVRKVRKKKAKLRTRVAEPVVPTAAVEQAPGHLASPASGVAGEPPATYGSSPPLHSLGAHKVDMMVTEALMGFGDDKPQTICEADRFKPKEGDAWSYSAEFVVTENWRARSRREGAHYLSMKYTERLALTTKRSVRTLQAQARRWLAARKFFRQRCALRVQRTWRRYVVEVLFYPVVATPQDHRLSTWRRDPWLLGMEQMYEQDSKSGGGSTCSHAPKKFRPFHKLWFERRRSIEWRVFVDNVPRLLREACEAAVNMVKAAVAEGAAAADERVLSSLSAEATPAVRRHQLSLAHAKQAAELREKEFWAQWCELPARPREDAAAAAAEVAEVVEADKLAREAAEKEAELAALKPAPDGEQHSCVWASHSDATGEPERFAALQQLIPGHASARRNSPTKAITARREHAAKKATARGTKKQRLHEKRRVITWWYNKATGEGSWKKPTYDATAAAKQAAACAAAGTTWAPRRTSTAAVASSTRPLPEGGVAGWALAFFEDWVTAVCKEGQAVELRVRATAATAAAKRARAIVALRRGARQAAVRLSGARDRKRALGFEVIEPSGEAAWAEAAAAAAATIIDGGRALAQEIGIVGVDMNEAAAAVDNEGPFPAAADEAAIESAAAAVAEAEGPAAGAGPYSSPSKRSASPTGRESRTRSPSPVGAHATASVRDGRASTGLGPWHSEAAASAAMETAAAIADAAAFAAANAVDPSTATDATQVTNTVLPFVYQVAPAAQPSGVTRALQKYGDSTMEHELSVTRFFQVLGSSPLRLGVNWTDASADVLASMLTTAGGEGNAVAEAGSASKRRPNPFEVSQMKALRSTVLADVWTARATRAQPALVVQQWWRRRKAIARLARLALEKKSRICIGRDGSRYWQGFLGRRRCRRMRELFSDFWEELWTQPPNAGFLIHHFVFAACADAQIEEENGLQSAIIDAAAARKEVARKRNADKIAWRRTRLYTGVAKLAVPRIPTPAQERARREARAKGGRGGGAGMAVSGGEEPTKDVVAHLVSVYPRTPFPLVDKKTGMLPPPDGGVDVRVYEPVSSRSWRFVLSESELRASLEPVLALQDGLAAGVPHNNAGYGGMLPNDKEEAKSSEAHKFEAVMDEAMRHAEGDYAAEIAERARYAHLEWARAPPMPVAVRARVATEQAMREHAVWVPHNPAQGGRGTGFGVAQFGAPKPTNKLSIAELWWPRHLSILSRRFAYRIDRGGAKPVHRLILRKKASHDELEAGELNYRQLGSDGHGNPVVKSIYMTRDMSGYRGDGLKMGPANIKAMPGGADADAEISAAAGGTGLRDSDATVCDSEVATGLSVDFAARTYDPRTCTSLRLAVSGGELLRVMRADMRLREDTKLLQELRRRSSKADALTHPGTHMHKKKAVWEMPLPQLLSRENRPALLQYIADELYVCKGERETRFVDPVASFAGGDALCFGKTLEDRTLAWDEASKIQCAVRRCQARATARRRVLECYVREWSVEAGAWYYRRVAHGVGPLKKIRDMAGASLLDEATLHDHEKDDALGAFGDVDTLPEMVHGVIVQEERNASKVKAKEKATVRGRKSMAAVAGHFGMDDVPLVEEEHDTLDAAATPSQELLRWTRPRPLQAQRNPGAQIHWDGEEIEAIVGWQRRWYTPPLAAPSPSRRAKPGSPMRSDFEESFSRTRSTRQMKSELKRRVPYYYDACTGRVSWLTEQQAAKMVQTAFRRHRILPLQMASVHECVAALKVQSSAEMRYSTHPNRFASRMNWALSLHTGSASARLCAGGGAPRESAAAAMYRRCRGEKAYRNHPVLQLCAMLLMLKRRERGVPTLNRSRAKTVVFMVKRAPSWEQQFERPRRLYFWHRLVLCPRNPHANVNWALVLLYVDDDPMLAYRFFRRAVGCVSDVPDWAGSVPPVLAPEDTEDRGQNKQAGTPHVVAVHLLPEGHKSESVAEALEKVEEEAAEKARQRAIEEQGGAPSSIATRRASAMAEEDRVAAACRDFTKTPAIRRAGRGSRDPLDEMEELSLDAAESELAAMTDREVHDALRQGDDGLARASDLGHSKHMGHAKQDYSWCCDGGSESSSGEDDDVRALDATAGIHAPKHQVMNIEGQSLAPSTDRWRKQQLLRARRKLMRRRRRWWRARINAAGHFDDFVREYGAGGRKVPPPSAQIEGGRSEANWVLDDAVSDEDNVERDDWHRQSTMMGRPVTELEAAGHSIDGHSHSNRKYGEPGAMVVAAMQPAQPEGYRSRWEAMQALLPHALCGWLCWQFMAADVEGAGDMDITQVLAMAGASPDGTNSSSNPGTKSELAGQTLAKLFTRGGFNDTTEATAFVDAVFRMSGLRGMATSSGVLVLPDATDITSDHAEPTRLTCHEFVLRAQTALCEATRGLSSEADISDPDEVALKERFLDYSHWRVLDVVQCVAPPPDRLRALRRQTPEEQAMGGTAETLRALGTMLGRPFWFNTRTGELRWSQPPPLPSKKKKALTPIVEAAASRTLLPSGPPGVKLTLPPAITAAASAPVEYDAGGRALLERVVPRDSAVEWQQLHGPNDLKPLDNEARQAAAARAERAGRITPAAAAQTAAQAALKAAAEAVTLAVAADWAAEMAVAEAEMEKEEAAEQLKRQNEAAASKSGQAVIEIGAKRPPLANADRELSAEERKAKTTAIFSEGSRKAAARAARAAACAALQAAKLAAVAAEIAPARKAELEESASLEAAAKTAAAEALRTIATAAAVAAARGAANAARLWSMDAHDAAADAPLRRELLEKQAVVDAAHARADAKEAAAAAAMQAVTAAFAAAQACRVAAGAAAGAKLASCSLRATLWLTQDDESEWRHGGCKTATTANDATPSAVEDTCIGTFGIDGAEELIQAAAASVSTAGRRVSLIATDADEASREKDDTGGALCWAGAVNRSCPILSQVDFSPTTLAHARVCGRVRARLRGPSSLRLRMIGASFPSRRRWLKPDAFAPIATSTATAAATTDTNGAPGKNSRSIYKKGVANVALDHRSAETAEGGGIGAFRGVQAAFMWRMGNSGGRDGGNEACADTDVGQANGTMPTPPFNMGGTTMARVGRTGLAAFGADGEEHADLSDIATDDTFNGAGMVLPLPDETAVCNSAAIAAAVAEAAHAERQTGSAQWQAKAQAAAETAGAAAAEAALSEVRRLHRPELHIELYGTPTGKMVAADSQHLAAVAQGTDCPGPFEGASHRGQCGALADEHHPYAGLCLIGGAVLRGAALERAVAAGALGQVTHWRLGGGRAAGGRHVVDAVQVTALGKPVVSATSACHGAPENLLRAQRRAGGDGSHTAQAAVRWSEWLPPPRPPRRTVHSADLAAESEQHQAANDAEDSIWQDGPVVAVLLQPAVAAIALQLGDGSLCVTGAALGERPAGFAGETRAPEMFAYATVCDSHGRELGRTAPAPLVPQRTVGAGEDNFDCAGDDGQGGDTSQRRCRAWRWQGERLEVWADDLTNAHGDGDGVATVNARAAMALAAGKAGMSWADAARTRRRGVAAASAARSAKAVSEAEAQAADDEAMLAAKAARAAIAKKAREEAQRKAEEEGAAAAVRAARMARARQSKWESGASWWEGAPSPGNDSADEEHAVARTAADVVPPPAAGIEPGQKEHGGGEDTPTGVGADMQDATQEPASHAEVVAPVSAPAPVLARAAAPAAVLAPASALTVMPAPVLALSAEQGTAAAAVLPGGASALPMQRWGEASTQRWLVSHAATAAIAEERVAAAAMRAAKRERERWEEARNAVRAEIEALQQAARDAVERVRRGELARRPQEEAAAAAAERKLRGDARVLDARATAALKELLPPDEAAAAAAVVAKQAAGAAAAAAKRAQRTRADAIEAAAARAAGIGTEATAVRYDDIALEAQEEAEDLAAISRAAAVDAMAKETAIPVPASRHWMRLQPLLAGADGQMLLELSKEDLLEMGAAPEASQLLLTAREVEAGPIQRAQE